ncbi:hypothetical protein IVA80_10995 [Bradyrhizobium sp. 139]|uniref:hypothetical protein n=1 Tax=Bradyrhizobium sp. 139 TaxID=2782616 RepID=UPI001FF96F6D|nr:hypothetical protein [Bradyrhizobium sp. 139]MCK1741377.1 hypothetical protein [Bradyrhizobium sp. 139]
MDFDLITPQSATVFGELELRQHLPDDVPLKVTSLYDAGVGKWLVRVQFLREARPPLDLGTEPLGIFPSELMIAQAMLVA